VNKNTAKHALKRTKKTKTRIAKIPKIKTNVHHPKKLKSLKIKKSAKPKAQNAPVKNKKSNVKSKDSIVKQIQQKNASKRKPLGKVIIVHGWDGDITKGWHPWLKESLESQGFEVILRQMPHSNAPQINEWVEALSDISGKVDKDTYFIGHSIGCQTIIRTLEKHDTGNVGGAIFIAGWFDLKDKKYTQNPKSEKAARKIARQWIEKSIDFGKVQSKFSPEKVVAIFSDNDPYVDMDNAKIFKEKLGARIIVENGMGHYSFEDNINTVPIVVEEFLKMTRSPDTVNTGKEDAAKK